jgi:hypothetical protein
MAIRDLSSNPHMIDQSSAFVSGTWMNPNTGHKFTVKDCVFENGELLIISTDGQHISGRMFADYVQDTGKDANGQAVPSLGNLSTPVSTPPVIVGDIPVTEEGDVPFGEFSREVSLDDPTLSDEANELLGVTKRPSFDPNLLEGVTHKPMNMDLHLGVGPRSVDLEMVTRVLRKHPLPTIDTLKWDKPVKQIETLTDILGIDMETIVEYYVNRINPEELVSMVKEYLTSEFLPKPVENGPVSRRTTKKRG